MAFPGSATILSTNSSHGGVDLKHVTITSGGLKSLSTGAPVIIFSLTVYATASQGSGFLQLFRQTSSGPTLGTTLPNFVLPIMVYTTSTGGGYTNFGIPPYPQISDPRGIVSSTGWSAAGTTTTTGSTLLAGNVYCEVILSGT